MMSQKRNNKFFQEGNNFRKNSLILQNNYCKMNKSVHNIDIQEINLTDAFYQRLIAAYGYAPEQLGRDVTIGVAAKADIAIWRSEEDKLKGHTPDIYVLVKCRSEHIRIEAADYIEEFKQAALNNMAFYVAHNLKETKVFYIDKEARPFKIEHISDFPHAKDIENNEALERFVIKMRSYTKDNFLKTLSRCHNIIRNMDKFSPEAAFDEISKVLFLKMLYERDSKDELVYSKEKFLKDEKVFQSQHLSKDYIQCLFDEVKRNYASDGLFDEEDKIRIRRESFLMILDELSTLELCDTSDDIKGIAFELFLGKTFRGELGQFFTPRTIVSYMVDLLNIREGMVVCDPCCGSGGFLIKAFEHIQALIDRDIHSKMNLVMSDLSLSEVDKQKSISLLLQECDKTKKGSRYYRLCHDYFYGVDANARMARTAKMNMVMHGDGHVGVYLHDGLLNVGGVYENRFDAILINPPFGAHIEKTMRITDSDVPSEREKNMYEEQFGREYIDKVYRPMKAYAATTYKDGTRGKKLRELYQITNSSTEILFVERCINLLKPGAVAGIVLPEGVLDNRGLEKVRKFIENKARILNITAIPSDVFLSSGANIKPSLLFIRKYFDKELPDVDYEMSVTRVNDAGISSTGLPSDNAELPVAANEVRAWIDGHPLKNMKYTKIVRRSELTSWSVRHVFDLEKASFNPKYVLVRLGDIMMQRSNTIEVQPDVIYTRLTIRLFNKGVIIRDTLRGSKIGTKRQTQVRTGDFVISKIDGKSAAFGFVDEKCDGAIVTSDFMVYYIDTNRVAPEYLEMVLRNEQILNQFKNSSSGTTGRRRLSQKVFENTEIALPSLIEQRRLLKEIISIRERQKGLEKLLQESEESFNKIVFDQL